MNIVELDRLAKSGEQMNFALKGYEQIYYIASRMLYMEYKNKAISLDQARAEKNKVVQEYEVGKGQWEFFNGLLVIEDKLKQLKQDGFNSALEFEILEQLEELLSAGGKHDK